MSDTQILNWALWGFATIAAVVAICAFFKLRYAERFLPSWNELTDLDAVLPMRREELRQVSDEIERLRCEIGQLEGTVGQLRILREWQDANPEAPARIQQMMTDLERFNSELAGVQQKLAQDEQRLNEITHETTRLTQEKQTLTDEVNVLRDRLTQLDLQQSAFDTMLRDFERRQYELEQLTAERDRRQSELDVLQQNLARDQQSLNAVVHETQRLSRERQELLQELDKLREQFSAIQKQKADLEASLRILEDQRRQDELALTGFRAEIDKSAKTLATLQQLLTSTGQEKADAARERDQARADRDSARAELDGLKKSLDFHRALVEKQNTELQLAGGGPTDITKALSDLAQPALTFKYDSSAPLEESTALDRFEKHLKSRSLHFPKRVQLAFHTSLKAAHINPLVVLAGVSGTGKSILPMAYSEALGINFLSLAVQPGWSGPQDLLGFYNYLERKYKATSLARALAQMSRFSKQDLPGLEIDSRDDQMLLLLLDEMNLARIEYYFSEFLSRLEQRRGRDIDDDQRRREVSLLIDAGSLVAGEASRFIFPDFNVLFVGTMNEDESTQSLSEKVVDRANVLRFGAPETLYAPGKDKSTPTTAYLSRKTWKKWLIQFDEGDFADELAQLKTINQSLDAVHRPFGHRVYQAILDYLANYPEVKNNAERRCHAFADQIEQKIIPKLRGLDTQDDATARCLDQIAKVIDGLKDKELSEAYKTARDQHLFEWFGVKRS